MAANAAMPIELSGVIVGRHVLNLIAGRRAG
jgi:hypothetical protein